MQTHESDLGAISDTHLPRTRSVDHDADPGASKAIAVQRPDVLSRSALLHLQRAAGNASVSALVGDELGEPSPVKDVIRSGAGRPLEPETRSAMEAGLGHDFGDVRIHTDARASESAKSVNAQAYTVGTNVVFQSDKYAPETDAGKRMLAHELTHVIQQKAGPVSGTPAPGGINISHPSDSFEQAAERSADRVTSTSQALPNSASVQGAAVQRQEEEEKATAQTSLQRAEDEEEEAAQTYVQRQAAGEEEEEEAAAAPSS